MNPSLQTQDDPLELLDRYGDIDLTLRNLGFIELSLGTGWQRGRKVWLHNVKLLTPIYAVPACPITHVQLRIVKHRTILRFNGIEQTTLELEVRFGYPYSRRKRNSVVSEFNTLAGARCYKTYILNTDAELLGFQRRFQSLIDCLRSRPLRLPNSHQLVTGVSRVIQDGFWRACFIDLFDQPELATNILALPEAPSESNPFDRLYTQVDRRASRRS